MLHTEETGTRVKGPDQDGNDPAMKKMITQIPDKGMAGYLLFPVLVVLIASCLLVTAAGADSTPESLTKFGRNLFVSSITSDPAVFFSGDSGTVTVSVTNGNANQSVSVSHATFGDKNIKLTRGSYDTTSAIGPLQTRTFTFSVLADSADGTYYPQFSISYFGTSSLGQPAVIQIDNSPLVLIVVNKPDTFVQGRKDTINVQIANPRKNDVKNVILEISGEHLTITPSKVFIGRLASGTSTLVNFSVTPDEPSLITLDVDYNNGDNVHSVSTTLPVTFSSDKKQADPVISNVKVTRSGGIYHVTGDVTNAGLLTANAVTVTSLSPAVPEDPYKSYIICALNQDDFGSFEVTFTADGADSIPVQLSYKDRDGNVITSVQQVGLGSAIGMDKPNNGPGILPVVIIVVIIVLAGGGYYYMKKQKSR